VLPLNAPLYREIPVGDSLPAGGRGGSGAPPAPHKPLPAPKSPVTKKPPAPVKPAPKPAPKKPVIVVPKSPPIVVTGPGSQSGLQAAQQLLATDPCALSSQQWLLLQQNGDVANTLPFSSACEVATDASQTSTAAPGTNDPLCLAQGLFGGPYPSCSTVDPQCAAEGMSGGPYPSCTAAGSLLSGISWTNPTTWPWWMWGGIAGGAYLLLRKKGRGRR
jgi:hypothetical protein